MVMRVMLPDRRIVQDAACRHPHQQFDPLGAGELDQFAGKTVDNFSLAEAGITSSPYVRVKLVVKGEVTKKVTVKLQGASATAIEMVQKAGGSFAAVERVARTAKEKTEK